MKDSIKRVIKKGIVALFLVTMTGLNAQEIEKMGDNFSLEGALELFRESESLEDFEKKLNNESNDVNNLDLNEDGDIDFISVTDYMEGELHAIVLQVAVSEKEEQDIAVIEIEKTGKKDAVLQIVGDESLYGDEYYVEPFETQGSEHSKGGPSLMEEEVRLVVNVWYWPSVQFIYRPAYRPYVSPYRWRNYPRWWKPRRVVAFNIFRPRTIRFKRNYRVTPTLRVVKTHRVYTPKRRSSKVVVSRSVTVRNSKGKTTVTKTTKVKKNGNKKVVTRKKTVKKKRN